MRTIIMLLIDSLLQNVKVIFVNAQGGVIVYGCQFWCQSDSSRPHLNTFLEEPPPLPLLLPAALRESLEPGRGKLGERDEDDDDEEETRDAADDGGEEGDDDDEVRGGGGGGDEFGVQWVHLWSTARAWALHAAVLTVQGSPLLLLVLL